MPVTRSAYRRMMMQQPPAPSPAVDGSATGGPSEAGSALATPRRPPSVRQGRTPLAAASPLAQQIRSQILGALLADASPRTTTNKVPGPTIQDASRSLTVTFPQNTTKTTTKAPSPKATTTTQPTPRRRRYDILSARRAQRSSVASRVASRAAPSPETNQTVPARVLGERDQNQKTAGPPGKVVMDGFVPPRPVSRVIVSPTNEPQHTVPSTTRRNLDKRTARLRYSESFQADIAAFDKDSSKIPRPPLPKDGSPTVHVIVRKRPMFHHGDARDFDVVRVHDQQSICIFDTKLGPDMSTRVVQPLVFPCDRAYSDTVHSRDLYQESVQPLVHGVLHQGKPATILLYGATGSGKSFTSSDIERYVAQDLFPTRNHHKQRMIVTVQYVEIAKHCRDLIHGTATVHLRDTASTAPFVGAMAITVGSVEEFQSVVQKAKAVRATEATQQNAVSSRSHAMLRITLQDSDCRRAGVLTLVDCAGTERKHDSMYHTKERQAESTEINASLYALKQCFRAKRSRQSNAHIPFRASLLTRALRESLEQSDARLLVVATIAPDATSTEHSVDTLRTVMDLMDVGVAEGKSRNSSQPLPGASTSAVPQSCPIAPKNWSHEQLVAFLTAKRLLSPTTTIPATLDGRQIMRMAKPQLRHALFQGNDTDKVDAVFRSLRAESDRVARLEFKRRCQRTKQNLAS